MNTNLNYLIILLFCSFVAKGQVADFSFTQASLCAPSTVVFTNTSTGTPLAVNWSFGDNSTDYNNLSPDPQHPYDNPGTYTVTLTVTYQGGVSVKTATIQVYSNPNFTFSKNRDSICPQESIAFSSTIISPNTNAIASYLWNFGDGNTSSQSNPTKIYQNATNINTSYNVSLTVTDTNGCQTTLTESNFVTVFKKPVVDFVADRTSICYKNSPTEMVNFTNRSTTLGEYTYKWLFGDGQTSTMIHPSNTYTIPQGGSLFSVSLIATSIAGCTDTLTKTDYINITVFKSLYYLSDTVFCDTPAVISCRGLNGSGTSYSWEFEPGQTSLTTASTVTHSYSDTGFYNLIIEATTVEGCKSLDTVVIKVFDEFIATNQILPYVSMCRTDVPFTLINTSLYPYEEDYSLGSCKWLLTQADSFLMGDTVTFSFGGNYGHTACYQVVVTPYGCPDTVFAGLLIVRPIEVDFTFSIDTSHCAPHKVKVFRSYMGAFESIGLSQATVFWDYPNSPDSTVFAPFDTVEHIYQDTGVFDLYVKIKSLDSCQAELFIGTVYVGYPPLADFTFTYEEDCYSNLIISLTAYDSLDQNGNLIARTATEGWDWMVEVLRPEDSLLYWDRLGEGNPASLSPGVLGYNKVKLLASHNGCVSEIIHDSVAYACPPIALIEEPFTHTLCDTGAIFCSSSSQLSTYQYWMMGDGTTWANQTKMGNFQVGVDSTSFPYNYLQHDYSFLYTNQGRFILSHVAINDDSINVNSPTYNRCAYCEDTTSVHMQISIAEKNVGSNKLTTCEKDPIFIYDSTTCNVAMYRWSFRMNPDSIGAFEFDSVTTIFHKDTNAVWEPVNVALGSKTIVLVMNQDEAQCLRYDTFSFTIYPKSKPFFASSLDSSSFAFQQEKFCANNPQLFYLKDSSSTRRPFQNTEIVQWLWVYNRDTSRVENPTFLSGTSYGYYDVYYRITNEYGCDSSINAYSYIVVNQIFPSVYISKKAVCKDEVVAFCSQSTVLPPEVNQNTIVTTIWDFGDGTPLVVSNQGDTVLHRYTTSTIFQEFELTMTFYMDSNLCAEVVYDTIVVTQPQAGFTASDFRFPCPGPVGRDVVFQDTSLGNIATHQWFFGDTNSGTSNYVVGNPLPNPTHNYARSGSFDVMLVVTDSIGCSDTLLEEDYIFIDGPTGSFTYAPTSGCLDLAVVFTPNIGNADTFVVNPDGANTITKGGAQINDTASFLYTVAKPYLPYFYLIKWVDNNGVYERCLVQWRGKDTIWAMDIDVDFEADSTYCQNNPLVFVNKTVVDPAGVTIDSCRWDFGDGTTSSSFNGQHTYTVAGTYTVTLDVFATACQQRVSKEIEVVSLSDFIFLPDSISSCLGMEVEFTAEKTAGTLDASSFLWTFDDGDTLQGMPVNKTFFQTGVFSYQVTVVLNHKNCVETFVDSVNVVAHSLPVADFEANPWTCDYGQNIAFVDRSTSTQGQIVQWQWDFGDGNTAQGQQTNHTYEGTSGYIDVLLLVTDQYGCFDTVIKQVLVLEDLVFPNVLTPEGFCEGLPCVFKPVLDFGYFKEFQMTIYDRWGTVIWENSCTEPNCPDYNNDFWWNGRNKKGIRVSDGVYYWVVTAIPLSQTKQFILNGSVSVFKEN